MNGSVTFGEVAMLCIPKGLPWHDTKFLMQKIVNPAFHIVAIVCFLIVAVIYVILPQLCDLVGNMVATLAVCLIFVQVSDIIKIFEDYHSGMSYLISGKLYTESLYCNGVENLRFWKISHWKSHRNLKFWRKNISILSIWKWQKIASYDWIIFPLEIFKTEYNLRKFRFENRKTTLFIPSCRIFACHSSIQKSDRFVMISGAFKIYKYIFYSKTSGGEKMTNQIKTLKCLFMLKIYAPFFLFLILDAVMYFSSLGAFFWLNGLSYYIWKTFR